MGDALRAAHRQAELGAFWWLADDDRARRTAPEPGRTAGGPLAGVPLAIKDCFDLAGVPTSGGLRGEHRSAGSDAVALRLLERAGAVAIGKTAMDPLAWTTSGQADGFPPCLNPTDRSLSPGGSSSGSAVAVAAGIVPLALGSDTAGSIRIPAAYCGVVGLKPAFGEVPLEGCLPLCASCDTVGVLARTVGGCAAAYDALTGGSRASVAATAAAAPPARFGGPIAILTDLFEATDPDVAAVCSEALRPLEAAGAELHEVALGWWAPGLGLAMAVEFAAAWGARADADPSVFSASMLASIQRARSTPPARYRQVRAELQQARERLERRLGAFSALVSPTVPIPVPAVGAEDVAVSTQFTRIFNALGWPALSVPCGRDRRGRPVGLHVASAGGVERAMAVAAAVQGNPQV